MSLIHLLTCRSESPIRVEYDARLESAASHNDGIDRPGWLRARAQLFTDAVSGVIT
jgi:hypothetical protein